MKKFNLVSLMFIFVFIGSFYSCSKNEFISPNNLNEEDLKIVNDKNKSDLDSGSLFRMNGNQLEGIHNQIASEFSQSIELTGSEDSDFDQELAQQVAQLNSVGFSNYFTGNGYSQELISAFGVYENYMDQQNVYSLISNSVDLSEEEAYQLFFIIEIADIVSGDLIFESHHYREANQNDPNFESFLSHYRETNQSVSAFSCGLALGATILNTVAAVTIATPIGLGFWLVTKAVSMVAVVDSCALI